MQRKMHIHYWSQDPLNSSKLHSCLYVSPDFYSQIVVPDNRLSDSVDSL